MARVTDISWAGGTWNVITGCSIVSPGCTNCYAMKLAGGRLKGHPSRAGLTMPSAAGPVWTGEVRFNEQWLDEPLRAKAPQSWFVVAHGDLFHPAVPDEWIDRVHGVIAAAPWHLFLVLTKRSKRARRYYTAPGLEGRIFPHYLAMRQRSFLTQKSRANGRPLPKFPLPNLWLGTSVEDQPRAERLDDLVATPAALHWVSVEPMLGDVDLSPWLACQGCGYTAADKAMHGDHLLCKAPTAALDLVIAGGESQRGARLLPPDQVRRLRDQVVASGAVFHFKQWGAWLPYDQVTTYEQRAAIAKLRDRNADRHKIAPGTAYKVGPKISGHMLDGVEHRDMPPWAAGA